jgi:small redox-active disulfide protein 2
MGRLGLRLADKLDQDDKGAEVRIQILGIACPECDEVTANVARALAISGLDADIERIEDPGAVKAMGVYVTPAIVIDGAVKVAGRVPSVDEIRKYLSE